MADLSKIKLPNGNEYDIKDATARSMISQLNQFTYEIVSTLPSASASTMYKIYLKAASATGTDDSYEEYITIDKGSSANPRYVWEKLGTITTPDLSNYVSKAEAGDLAYKDSASGSVDVPKTYTFTGTSATGTISGTAAAQTFKGNGVRLQTDSEVATGASFSGSATTSTGKFTPKGSISVGTGTANYTPAGSVSTPTITVTPSTTTKYVASSASGGGSVTAGSAASWSASVPTGTETLEFSWSANTPTAVTLPTFSSQTIATGITSASSTQPTFSGDGTELKFTGTEGDVSVSGTPNGSVTLTKSNVTVSPAASGTATYTPGGTNAASTVSGSATVTATGSVATATTESKTVTVS